MSRKATRKDVLYALQFGHERLIKTIQPAAKNPDTYALSVSGVTVEPGIARDILNDPHVRPLEDGLFPGFSQQFEWVDEAA